MKKLILSLALFVGLTLAAHAIDFTTSCGTQHSAPGEAFANVEQVLSYAEYLDSRYCN